MKAMGVFKLIRETKRFTAYLLAAVMLLSQPQTCVFAGEESVSYDAAAAYGETDAYDEAEKETDPETIAEEGCDGQVTEAEEPIDVQDEYPVGEDALLEGEDGKDAELEYDEKRLVSELSGTVCDPALFSAAPAVLHDEPVIKLQWKIKGAKYFTLDRYLFDGSCESVVIRTTKKKFTDETAFDNENCMHIYRLKVFDKMGSLMSDMVTIPSANILSYGTGITADTVKLVFAKMGHYYRYTVERASKKKFDAIDNTFPVYADDEKAVVSVTSASENSVSGNITGNTLAKLGYLIGKSGKTLALDSLAISDESTGIVGTKKNFYRVNAILDVPGLDIVAKPSATVMVKNAKYPAPIITYIGRYLSEEDEEATDHDLCYRNGNVYVRVDWNFLAEVQADSAEFVLYRAGMNGKYKKITSELISDLTKVSALDGSKKDLYVIPYDNFPPEVTYDYRVAISYKGVGAMSEPMERTGHFDKVEMVSAGEHAFDEVKLKWKSDPCAVKYNIYRSIDTWDSLEDAENAGLRLDKDRFKKVGTKKNDTPREGSELEFIDRKKLEVGMYHIYRIVPVNKKEAPFMTCSDPMALRAYPASPEKVFVYPVNINSMDIVWEPADDAVMYKIQRTNKTENGVPVFSDQQGVDFKEWEYKVSGKNSISKVTESTGIKDDFGESCIGYNYINVQTGTADNSVELGTSYYYRVVAACKIKGGAVMWADEESASWTEAHLQLAGVRDMNATLYGSKSTADGSNVAQIAFKSSGEDSKTAVDNVYDFRRVDHYDIVTSTTERGLDTATPMTIDGTTFSYTTTSGTTNVNIHEKPDTTLFKNVRGVKRGKAYYFGVRTVYKTAAGKEIKGNWRKRKFILPVEVFIYPDSGSRSTTNSTKTRYEIPAGETRTFVIDFDPYDTTFTDVTVALTTTSGTAFTKTDIETDKNGKRFFKVTAPSTTTSTTSTTVIPQTTITVTAKNVGATGDVKSQLIKYFYIKAKPAKSST